MMSGSGSSDGKAKAAVKVVIIETRYIETDSANFKAVVQRLTGKDANIVQLLKSPPVIEEEGERVTENSVEYLRAKSFNDDFDKFLTELPYYSLDDIFQMTTDD